MTESIMPLPDSWQEQIKNSVYSFEQLKSNIDLLPEELEYFNSKNSILTLFRITPYYLSVIKKDKTNRLRRSVIPNSDSFLNENFNCSVDPLEEENNSPCKHLVHKYPDRVLLLVTDFCSNYCLYCTRSRKIYHDPINDLSKEFEYIRNNKQIRDVIISGGDPLMLSNEKLESILKELTNIKHLEVIRIGTKIPVVLPQRIDKYLLKVLTKYSKKLWINIHFTHPEEITKETKKACWSLNKLGIPLGSQTVLLNKINDDPKIMLKLMQKLLSIKVVPRYLYNCDSVITAMHFKVPIEKGLEIIRAIQGHTSGMACPKFVIDSPQGKLPLDLSRVKSYTKDNIKFVNYEGKEISIDI